MDVLADTNILIRGVHRGDQKHKTALQAIRTLRTRGDRICVCPQNLYEFWAVATRPFEQNGLALAPSQAARIISRIEEICMLLPDAPGIYEEWRRLVEVYAVSGKQSHDTRLVAAMNVHGVTHILSFNSQDFARYPDVTVIDPHLLHPTNL